MARLTLYGGCAYGNAAVENTNGYISSVETEALKANPLSDLAWNDNTVLRANFKNGLTGGNFEGDFAADQDHDVDRFRIYTTYGNQPQLHKVGETSSTFETGSATETIIEDFAVGSECQRSYYIVPVCNVTEFVTEEDEDGNEIEVEYVIGELTGDIIKSEPITLNDGVIRVIGLIKDEDNPDTYYVDMNNIWNFSLNVSNTGFTNNMGKTYNDTPQKYPVEVKNKGFYRTFDIGGLLGRFDCGTMDYVDTYDDIIEWERFVDDDNMKLVIDLRGIMTVGSIENSSIQYDDNGANFVYANFSIKQLEDINEITILNRSLIFNPNSGIALLMDADGLALQDKDQKYLVVKETE